jgi:acetoin utilization protein AcuB
LRIVRVDASGFARWIAQDAAGTPNAPASGMSKPIPAVQRFMTRSPHTIGADQTMAQAHTVMRSHRVRHLPVLTAGKLVGVVSAGDLHLIETLKDVVPEEVKVEDAMTQQPYTASPDTPVDEVMKQMAEHKYGCVVVLEREKVAGIFTTVDALRAFVEILHHRR